MFGNGWLQRVMGFTYEKEMQELKRNMQNRAKQIEQCLNVKTDDIEGTLGACGEGSTVKI